MAADPHAHVPEAPMSDSGLLEYLKTCPRAGSWTASVADRYIIVDVDTFVQIAVNHCHKSLGGDDSVRKRVLGGALYAVHLQSSENAEIPYDVVIALKTKDIPRQPREVRGHICSWITDIDHVWGKHQRCGFPAMHKVSDGKNDTDAAYLCTEHRNELFGVKNGC